jgi:hypothetical protein
MRLASLGTLIRRDLRRTRGALATSGFGIAAGTAALFFFLALGLGVRGVLLGEVFPIDQIELEPPKATDPGLLGLLMGAGEPPGISAKAIQTLSAEPGVIGVFPKLKMAVPASARGGKEILGREVGTSEMIADGIDPGLVQGELKAKYAFADPLQTDAPACEDDNGCTAPAYCERPSGAERGRCSDPVPVLVSRYLLEIFDKSIAPAHNLPPVGETLVMRAEGVTFQMRLGESLLGKARSGSPRAVRVRMVGISRRAIDVGLTFPLEVVRRWNREYSGEAAADRYSSAIVQMQSNGDTSELIAKGAAMGLVPKDTRARDVSVLVTGVMALLTLVAGIILIVSASNIAYTFRVLVGERQAEIALYRAVGATAGDIRIWVMSLALVVGILSGAIGLVAAWGLSVLTDWIAAGSLPDFPFKPATFFSFPWWLWLAGLGFAALFAMLGAIGPALRGARVNPAGVL